MHIGSSEETPEEVDLGATGEGGFSVSFDPLDGSSIIDTNFSVGSIFGIWPGMTPSFSCCCRAWSLAWHV